MSNAAKTSRPRNKYPRVTSALLQDILSRGASTPAVQASSYISDPGDVTQPYSVRASCGHIVIRRMRPSTAGVPYTPTLVIDRPNGAACASCEGVRR